MKFNWKYLLFDILKVGLPVLIAAFIPDTAPQAEILTTALYLFASVLGIDATKKSINYYRK